MPHADFAAPKIVFIFGHALSGKYALARSLAVREPAEIFFVDALRIHRGMAAVMDCPTAGEQSLCPHRLLEELDPSVDYDAARFAARGLRLVLDAWSQNRDVIAVVETHVYFRALAYSLKTAARVPFSEHRLGLDPPAALLDARADAWARRALRAGIVEHTEALMNASVSDDSRVWQAPGVADVRRWLQQGELPSPAEQRLQLAASVMAYGAQQMHFASSERNVEWYAQLGEEASAGHFTF